MFWQPLLAQADGIAVSAPGTSLGVAGNGIPIINIAAPNGSGLSHNQFKDYNVGASGVILNNATNSTQSTQLGGIILGNPNFNGTAASIILNEVNGGSPSQLSGYTEVAGQSAKVIVANPYGISCSGCGFINTPNVTLTTGTPVLDNGRLDHYQVDGGTVTIDGKDLDASQIDHFEIITRSAKINAQINARNLAIVAGRNDVDALTLNTTVRAEDGSVKPELAIDSSVLGGMYAGAIKLVGTEAGVGVKLAGNLGASGGDIRIDAAGNLTLTDTRADSGVTLNATSLNSTGAVYAGTALDVHTTGALTNQKNFAAGDSINLSSGGELTNLGIIEAGVNADNSRNTNGDLTVTAQTVTNTGNSLVASRNLTVSAAQALNNQGGTLSAKQAANLSTGILDNQNKGRVLSTGSLSLNADQLLNAQGGLLNSSGPLTATVGKLSNSSGEVSSLGALTLNVATLDNVAGLVTANNGLSITASGAINNQGGKLTSLDVLNLTAGAVDNSSAGHISSNQALTANVSNLDQHNGGQLTSVTSLTLDVNKGQLNNQSGLIHGTTLALNNLADVGNQNGEISSNQGFTFAAKSLDNTSGKLLSEQALTLRLDQALINIKGLISAAALQLKSATLDNSDGMLSSRDELGVTVDGAFNNQGGTAIGDGDFRLDAASLDNSSGQVSSKGALTANVNALTNNNGILIAEGALALNGSTLDNRNNGLVGGTQGVKLQVGGVDNRGGEISSSADVSLQGQQLNNSDSGRVIAGKTLSLTVDNVLNLNGLLSTQTGLSLTGAGLDNTGGSLISQAGLALNVSGDLNNTQGLLSSEGVLTLNAANLTNRQGKLSSAGQLSVTTSGATDNQGGQLVTDGGLTLNSASLDNSQSGTLSSKSALTIDTGTFDNSHSGNVSTSDTLNINAGQVTNQDGGRLSSDKTLTAKVTGLDQQGGKLFSNTAVALDLNHGQLNNQGGLINAPLLMLKNLKGVNNQGGEISSAQAFTVAAESLDNSSGKLLSNQALTLRIDQVLSNLKGQIAAQSIDGHAASLDNSGGTLTSRGDTLLNIDGALNNQSQGLINATDTLTINSTGINNQQGSLLGSAIAIDLSTATGDLNNNGGMITTAGSLTLQHLRDLSNQSGEISSAQSLNLSGRTLDNSAGKLISNNLLALTGTELLNQGGLISGWQGVSLSGTDLDNRNNGTVSSRYGNVAAQFTQSVLNSGAGALVSQQALTVTAASLDNSDNGILSSGGGQTLTVTGPLNNSQGGLIDSGATLDVQAPTLINAGGAINAQQNISVTGTTVDNTAGTLIGNSGVTLDLLGVLTNTNGKLASTGALLLKRATQINNQGGQIASQDLLTLLAGNLDNSNRGTVAANGTLTLTTTGAIQNNSDGLIYSQNADVQLNAASLDNAKGSVQSQTALNLSTDGDIDNQSGKVIAQANDVSLTAANIDNRGGTLASLGGALHAKVVGVLRNGYDLNNNSQAGVTQAESLDLVTGSVDNNGGRISAQSADAIVTTGNFDNRNGGLYAKGLVSVTGNDFDNNGTNDGQIAGHQIDLNLSGALNNQLGIIESDTTLKVSAASLDNQTGQLRALGTDGKTEFQIGGLFDNSNGVLETANTDLTLNAGSFQNVNGSVLHVGTGTFEIAPGNLNGVGGSVVTRGGLSIDQDTWTNDSVIQAGRLTLNVNTLTQSAAGQLLAADSLVASGVNWVTNGIIASDGSLDLNLSGALNGTGRISSLGNLNLSAAQVDLSSTASIAGGGLTTATVSGALNNNGRLTSAADLSVTAGTINNYGTLGSGQALTVTTGALLNDHGLIFSGSDMSLRVDSLNNSYADIYSLGNLNIDRDGQGGLASSIINSSSSIQSDGNLNLSASTIQNVRAVLSTSDLGIYTARIDEVTCIEGYNAGDCSGKQNHAWEVVQRDKVDVTDASAASSITAGGNLTINGGDLLNASSSIGAAGNLSATVSNLTNSGIETGETETTRIFMTERTSDASGWYAMASAFTNKYWYLSPAYTPNDLGGLQAAMSGFIGTTLEELPQLRTTQKIAEGDQTYAAIIQAGGAVNVTAQNTIDNSVVQPGFTYVGAGAKTGTDATGAGGAGSTYSTRVTLNQQLPPDLAQQQINPLTLPGFSLPTGQNGLFRLSGQGDTAPTNQTPQSWTLGSAVIGTAQHQQAAPSSGIQAIQVGDAVQTALNTSTPVQATAASLLTVNRVQGLPDDSRPSNPQKYLIETNPALTNLTQFMSSDYLLSNLGYDPDQSWKRLGDGLYEEQLIQQAVIARTGQQFIDGQTSDAGLYKYLMDNAITSQQQLNLSVGVSLTAEQVASLTHDIVWMEDATVNGEQVLVPVLYLAQADNRLGPTGALIAGSDVSLIAGSDLTNAGTLSATGNLSAQAGQNMVNSGLVEAGDRLDLLAGNNLTNQAGGIIAGSDVSVTAVNGDVNNERTVTSHESSSGYRTEGTDFVDSAARIEAANNLSVQAGEDVNNVGGVLSSGADTTIVAGRDVNLVAAEQVDSNAVTDLSRSSDVTQYGSIIEAGRDFQVTAARNISAIASQIDATRDVAMSATGNLSLASAADEQHSALNTKKVTTQEDHVSQVSTTVTAGGNVDLSAGNDMALIASRVSAGNEAYLVAGGELDVLAAQNSDYSLYDMKKTGSWGSKKTQHDEVTDVKNVSSEIQTGGALALVSGGDQLYQDAKLNSGGDLSLSTGGSITFEAVKDLHDESHTKSDNNAFWVSAKGKGTTDETLHQSELTAKGQLTINAVDGLHIDLKQIDQDTVSQSIDAMVQADPSLAWLKDAEKRGDVDWRQVQEIHDSFKYNTSGLGPASKVIIAILMSVALGPAGLGLGGIEGTAEISLATTAVTSFIDDKGNLGSTLKDTFSSDSLKNAAVAGISAGVLNYADTNWLGSTEGSTVTTAGPLQNASYSSDMLSWSNAEQTLLRSSAHALINSGISTAINGGSFGQNLSSAALSEAISLGAAAGNKAIGDATNDIASKLVLHAVLGGLLSKAAGQDFASGVVAGGVAEGLTPLVNAALSNYVSKIFDANNLSYQGSQTQITTAQLIGVVSGAMAGGDPNIAALIGGSADKYNRQGHEDLDPTVIFGDEDAAHTNDLTPLQKAYAQLSLAIFSVLVPEVVMESLLARMGAMFSEMGDGLVGATATGVENVSGSTAIDATAGAGETVSSATKAEQVETEVAESAGGEKEAVDSAAKLSQGQQRAVNKIDNILNSFKDSDITGTLKDMAGDPVPKPDGGYWDHLKEMNDMLRGLRNHAETLEGVSDPVAQAARQRALDTIQRINSALNGAGI
ncbi:filamentous hemagglutinin N-terminal domain-containing protein [Pseudomonas sp. IPO3778]